MENNQEIPFEGPLEHYSPKTGERYLVTEDFDLIAAGNIVESEAWLNTGLGDSSENRRYDNQSRVIVAERDGEVVGVSRIFQHGEFQLPALSQMPYDNEKQKADIEELVNAGLIEEFGITARNVSKSHRRETALNMFRIAYRDAKNRGIKAWLIIMEPPRVKKMNRWYKFTFEKLGPEIYYQGGDCAVHILKFDEVERSMRDSSSKRANWFEEEAL